ncbi:MAG: hypothetical protein LBD51_00325 [Bifidobacteriaceae bacterium]|nr:hypothetical protein [Bifidobacteriaceae bacterium]
MSRPAGQVAVVSLGRLSLDGAAQNALRGALAAGFEATAVWLGGWDGPAAAGRWEGAASLGLGGGWDGGQAPLKASWWRYRDMAQQRAGGQRLAAQRLRAQAAPGLGPAARTGLQAAGHRLRARARSAWRPLGQAGPHPAAWDGAAAELVPALVGLAPQVIQVLDLELAPAAALAARLLRRGGSPARVVFQPRHLGCEPPRHGPQAAAATGADLVVAPRPADLPRLASWGVATPALCLPPALAPQSPAPHLTAHGLAGLAPGTPLGAAFLGPGWPWAPLALLDALEVVPDLHLLVFCPEAGRPDAPAGAGAALAGPAARRGLAERLHLAQPPPAGLAAAALAGAAVGIVPWAVDAAELPAPPAVGACAWAGVPLVVSQRAVELAQAVLAAGAGQAYDPAEPRQAGLAVKAALASRERLAGARGPGSPLARQARPAEAAALYRRLGPASSADQ